MTTSQSPVATIPLFLSSVHDAPPPSPSVASRHSGYPRSVRAYSQESLASGRKTQPPALPPKPTSLLGRERVATIGVATSEFADQTPAPQPQTKPAFHFPRYSPKKAQGPPSLPPRKGAVVTPLNASATPPRIRMSSSPQPYVSTTPRAAVAVAPRLGNSTNIQSLKERLVASAGLGLEWGKKGKSKLAARLDMSSEPPTSAGARARHPPSSSTLDRASSPFGAADNPIKLPATILGVRVPRRTGFAFGVPLERVVEATHIHPDGLHRRRNTDEVSGDNAQRWLPAVALRCLQYLDKWGATEEGLYRVPGSSYQIAQLRALFDAGVDIDLRDIHVGDLDPHAVASLFKAWLRELPDSLLSSNLEAAVQFLVKEGAGISASPTSFLEPGPSSPLPMRPPTDGRAPRELLEKLASLFSGGMPPEEFYLLRAISYHLARLASHAATNKMTLDNLKLVLTPTLRLSPKMLQILVEEREILFCKPNEAAKIREAAADVVPSLASYPSRSNSSTPSLHYSSSSKPSTGPSPSASPLISSSSPRFGSTPLPDEPEEISSSSSWHIVNGAAGSFSPTPIADRFGSSEPPSPKPSASSTSAAIPSSSSPSRSFVPNRSPGGGSLFTASRDVALVRPSKPESATPALASAPASSSRLASASVASSVQPRMMKLQDIVAERSRTPQDERVPPLRQWSEETAEGELSPPGGRMAEPRVSDECVSYDSHSSMNHSYSTHEHGAIGRVSARHSSSPPLKPEVRAVPLLTLPRGLDPLSSGERNSWGLLTIEERRRFFES